MENKSFLKLVSTGVNDEQINNIEVSLPFNYFLYSLERSFYISINRKVFNIKKNQAVLIKKSTPFTVLLNWGKGENGEERRDIVGFGIPEQVISEYSKKNIDEKMLNKNHQFNIEFIFLDFSFDNELKLVCPLVLALMNYDMKLTKETCPLIFAKFFLLFSIVKEKDKGLDDLLWSCSTITLAEKISNLVISDYSKNWSGEELANYFNMSLSSLKKKMYNERGSVSNFITKIKMTEALRQLRRTKKPINSIAYSLGYSSTSYFTSVFKRTFSLNPSDIRKKNNSSHIEKL